MSECVCIHSTSPLHGIFHDCFSSYDNVLLELLAFLRIIALSADDEEEDDDDDDNDNKLVNCRNTQS